MPKNSEYKILDIKSPSRNPGIYRWHHYGDKDEHRSERHILVEVNNFKE